MQIKEFIKYHFAILNKKDIDTLFTFLHKDAVMSTPVSGILKGHENIKYFIISQREWLVDQNAKLDIVNTISSDETHVFEFFLSLHLEEKQIKLPFAVALDIQEKLVVSIRMYYSIAPLVGAHRGITPLLEKKRIDVEQNTISQCLDAIGSSDTDQFLSCFEEDAYIQEPEGSNRCHKGKEEMRKFFEEAMKIHNDSFYPYSIIHDGTDVAVEYLFDYPMSNNGDLQAGMILFSLGATEKIGSMKLFHDAGNDTKNNMG